MITAPAAAALEVVQAGHILAAKGVLDAFGHASRRHPQDPALFLMSRNLAPASVTQADILVHDLAGQPVSEPGARVYLERFIHAEIYRRRPDVQAIVHSHSPSVLPFTVSANHRVRPLCHLCGFLAGTAHPFEIAAIAGDGTDLLIRSAALGQALADHLGEQAVVLMRGHGFTCVGDSMAEAVFRAVYTGVNCQAQLAALQLGPPTYLTEAEARACEAATRGQADRAWALWAREVARP